MHDNPTKQLSDVLEEMEARANAATRGPWKVTSGFGGEPIIEGLSEEGRDTYVGEVWEHRPDGAFIAAARQDVPALCAALRRAVDIIVSDALYVGPTTRGYLNDISRLLTSPTRRKTFCSRPVSNTSKTS